ncbi:nucleotidyltransferase domain-containing protein [Streptosporangium carneum]|uniref:Nucleotidyltransferase n=1 Tax=Streptosporangium carneum TaxID=47481 RepID=A0A9W6MAC2_9ACTN|nr:nucleotidyltransferase domain-containing protein [Streptosporangium carneum]GLK06852.1 nucleotidyltransferase [Streptosporangium carneum]
MTGHAPTTALLDRFVADVAPLVPLTSVWAHGSLAGGDYQPGRSDLDLIAVLHRPCAPEEERRLTEAHERLGAAVPLAAKLHCSYAVVTELDDPERPHLTWAHEEIMRRPITPVTRRELHEFGLVLYGGPPASVLPPVTDEELTEFVVRDLREFWRPHLDHPELWLHDIWVDAALLTLARGTVTLRDGRLVTKRQALAVLREMRAPARVVDDVERRRYGPPGSPGQDSHETRGTLDDARWLADRASLTLGFLTSEIDAIMARHPVVPTPDPCP